LNYQSGGYYVNSPKYSLNPRGFKAVDEKKGSLERSSSKVIEDKRSNNNMNGAAANRYKDENNDKDDYDPWKADGSRSAMIQRYPNCELF
jgi:hypothetical protein